MSTIVESNLDQLICRLQRSSLYTSTAKLYTEGIRGKLRLARHCTEALSIIEDLDESTLQVTSFSSTSALKLSTDDQVLFYCESLWSLLRSSIDILAQLINELRSLGMSERQVDFNGINNRMRSTELGSPLQKAMQSLEKSRAFRDLSEYRRCCTHRRQVFVKKDMQQITQSSSGTPGYTHIYTDLSTQTTSVTRFLCDNPWDVNPHVDGTRPVAAYNQMILEHIEKRLGTILKRLP